MTEIFFASNIKCNGCIKTIVDGLKTLDGVTHVTAQIEDGKVTVEGNNFSKEIITKKLAELGYPEKKKSLFSFFK